jgi:hypothetical protein
MTPGCTEVTETFVLASSVQSASLSAFTPAFVIE